MYDVAIVGYGPAGITAAIYVARRRLKTLLVGELPGGEVLNSGVIENWPGGATTDGVTLAQDMIKHLQNHQGEVDIVQGKVQLIRMEGEEFILDYGNEKSSQAKTVIYATGRHPRELGVPGEKEFKNLGVSYCTICDAPLFNDKTVAVVGGGNTGAEAVIMLQNFAKKVYFLHIGQQLAADAVLLENIFDNKKTEVIVSAKTLKIGGNKSVEGLEYEDLISGTKRMLPVEGVFVAIGATPNIAPVKDLVKLNEWGAIVADRYGVTNQAGFFAAGDVTNVRDAQIVVAAGHGCSAALSAGDYIARM